MPIDSYDYKISEITIGKNSFRIAAIKNPESLFNDFLEKKQDDADVADERIPYWSDLWPSAIALAEYINENPELVYGKSILEIGSGMSLPGIVAAKLGGDVMLTDYLPEAMEFAAHNWKLNFNSEANIRHLDWRSPGEISPVDVLLASDVAYESRAFEPLLIAMKALIKQNGVILISEPNRKFAKQFFTELQKAGFTMTEETKNILKDGVNNKISIYLARSSADNMH